MSLNPEIGSRSQLQFLPESANVRHLPPTPLRRRNLTAPTIQRHHHDTSWRILDSLRGLLSTYMAVVRIFECPANTEMALRSIPRSARLVMKVRRPECELALGMPASTYSYFRNRAIDPAFRCPPF